MAEEKTVVFQIHRDSRIPQLNVSYRNKHELFAAYKEWIKGLNLPSNEVYWCDCPGDHMGIRNADDLLGAVQGDRLIKLFTPYAEEDMFFSSDSEEDTSCRGRGKEKKRTTNSRRNGRTPSLSPSPSPSRKRTQSRSVDRQRHRSFSERRHGFQRCKPYLYDCMPFPWYFMVDPRFMPRQCVNIHRCSARGATCRGKDTSKDVDNR
ncbi:hypothetical protein Y032_0112g278 [Ancylostoma ceylanicum]|uniref:Uncharacterized protein n=1 Tax=Ancylostoma ceylanicum TaxID=53326 RepID=A0A016TDX7_9BILA|nr:hypothetical protein Y032_0112g278 [Ancylostoma ceylanicum]